MTKIEFKPGIRCEADGWTQSGDKITNPEKLELIRETLESNGLILLEHRLLRGSRSPHCTVFTDYDHFVAYLVEHARAGDSISVWNLWPFMRDTPPLAYGKCPATDDTVPAHGPY